jgi:DNA gyrase/topoisomerase IV subunit A
LPSGRYRARGCLGMRVNVDDEVVAVTAVSANSSVFLLGADGKGALRQMSGLRANKAPGAGGKQLMKTERLVQAVAVEPADDLFIISQLSKIIRFTVAEAPPKEGVVQGVNCIALRNDAATAVMRSAPPSET